MKSKYSISRENFILLKTELNKKGSYINYNKQRKIANHNSAVVGMK